MYCPVTGKMCQSTGCGNRCMMQQYPPKPIQYGWECPRCHKIHSPYSLTCDCQPATLSGNTTMYPENKNQQH